jgi:hypothetical protein
MMFVQKESFRQSQQRLRATSGTHGPYGTISPTGIMISIIHIPEKSAALSYIVVLAHVVVMMAH